MTILMKIKNVELSWFRGSAQHAILETHSKSVVIYGPNASGKSTFPDAFEYLFKNGKIHHLSHEYSGRKQEKGVRNTHAGENNSELVFTFEGDKKASILINEDGTNVFTFEPETFKDMINSCKANQIILRQDEISNFVNSNKGEKYSALLPLLGLSELETAIENFSNLKELLLEESQFQEIEHRYTGLMEEASKIIPSFDEGQIQKSINDIGKRYLAIFPKDHSEVIEKLSLAIEEKIKKVNSEVKRYTILKQIDDENLTKKLNDLIKNQEQSSHDIDSLLGRKLDVLERSSEFSKCLGEEDRILCPSCGQEIERAKYIRYVESELKHLNKVKEIYQKAKNSRRSFSDSIKQVIQKTDDEDISKWLELVTQKELNASFKKISEQKIDETQESFTQEKLNIIKPNIVIINDIIKKEIEKTLPAVEALLIDKEAVNIIKKIPEIEALGKKMKGIKSIIDVFDQAETSIHEELKNKTQFIINQISKDIMGMWSKLHPGEPIEDIHLNIPDSTDEAIDICLKFHGVDQSSPRLTLSEGYRNSLGLCIFLTLAKISGKLDQPILLDDIITSQDREHRSFVADLLLTDFSCRQILLFTHEREWFSELTYRLPHSNWIFLKLKPWEKPEIGLQWIGSFSDFDEALSLLSTDVTSAGNKARGIMDTNLSIIADKLKITLTYIRGDKNDHRGAVEFLEHITSEVEKGKRFRKKTENSDSYEEYSEPINDWKTTISLLIPWANRASHGGYVTNAEVEKLIEMCRKSLDYFKCSDCGEFAWISNQESRKRLQCCCGKLQWRYD